MVSLSQRHGGVESADAEALQSLQALVEKNSQDIKVITQ